MSWRGFIFSVKRGMAPRPFAKMAIRLMTFYLVTNTMSSDTFTCDSLFNDIWVNEGSDVLAFNNSASDN